MYLSESGLCFTTKLINMHEAHKAYATRWPPSRHLRSGHLQLIFRRARPKHAPEYRDYQLLEHLYIPLRKLFDKGTNASVQLQPTQCYAFTLRQYSPPHSSELRVWYVSHVSHTITPSSLASVQSTQSRGHTTSKRYNVSVNSAIGLGSIHTQKATILFDLGRYFFGF